MRELFLSTCLLSLLAVTASSTRADDRDYANSLQIVQKKIERERAAQAAEGSGALSSALLYRLLGRYYQVGDRWDVAAWLVDHPNLAPNPGHAHASSAGAGASRGGVRTGGIFRYEVVAVKGAPNPSVTIEVRQLDAHGFKPVDSKVEKLTLNMNDKMVQSEKAYTLQGQAQPVRVAPNGVRSRLTTLELFPLDIPELVTAVAETPKRMPKLPPAAEALVAKLGLSPRLDNATWFEQDDFFGRPIQALWEKGKLWPSYFRTSNGIAVLLTR